MACPIGSIKPLGRDGSLPGIAPGILAHAVPPACEPSALTGSGFPSALHWNKAADPTAPTMFGLGRVAPGIVWPKGSAEKSPFRIARLGTKPVNVTPRRRYFCSPSTKKNVLFLRIGPPMDPPNWFKLNFSVEVAKKLLASRSVLRKNSYKLP